MTTLQKWVVYEQPDLPICNMHFGKPICWANIGFQQIEKPKMGGVLLKLINLEIISKKINLPGIVSPKYPQINPENVGYHLIISTHNCSVLSISCHFIHLFGGWLPNRKNILVNQSQLVWLKISRIFEIPSQFMMVCCFWLYPTITVGCQLFTISSHHKPSLTIPWPSLNHQLTTT